MYYIKKICVVVSLILGATTAQASCNDDQALNALALNIYHEARGESLDGQVMVGEVTINRAENPLFPDTVCGVVYQGRKDTNGNMIRYQCQFSWYCDGKSDKTNDLDAWAKSLLIAAEVLDQDFLGPNDKATHYLNPDKVRRMPRWTRVYAFVGSVGSHDLYYVGDRL
jgi:N-acetylmuramoyl-L-alanine amidase